MVKRIGIHEFCVSITVANPAGDMTNRVFRAKTRDDCSYKVFIDNDLAGISPPLGTGAIDSGPKGNGTVQGMERFEKS